MRAENKKFSFPFVFLAVNIFLVIGIYFIISQSVERSLTSAITNSTQASNAAVTRLFINEIYPDLAAEISLTANPAMAKDALSPEEVDHVDERVRQFMFGTDILKAKIYNINGVTVYSSDLSQIGENKSGNMGFDSAIRGVPASQVTHRGNFSALDGEVFDRDLVASYIPIYQKSGEIVGVAELYTDRSSVIIYSAQLSNELKIELLPLLASLLLAIAMIVWRFQMIITRLRVQILDKSD